MKFRKYLSLFQKNKWAEVVRINISKTMIVVASIIGVVTVGFFGMGCAPRQTQLSARTPDRDALVAEIHKFKGTPYVYGGSTPSGTDCSGFTMTVFKPFGLKLPHSASKQAQMGQQVPRENLEMGDLVFFKTGGSKTINHVGIHLWDGKMAHASSSNGVIVVKWVDNVYYEHRYAGAVRVFDFEQSRSSSDGGKTTQRSSCLTPPPPREPKPRPKGCM